MSVKEKADFYLSNLSEPYLQNAITYLQFLHKQSEDAKYAHNTPLDAFDYHLAMMVEDDDCNDRFSFDEVLQELGLTYEDLQD